MSAPYRNPGIYSDYPSSMVSKYYTWFKELGYPQLDINQFDDGEWNIIEYYNSPIIPSLTRWKPILTEIKYTEPSYGFVKKYVEMLDITKEQYWDLELGKSQKLIDDGNYREKRREEIATRMAEIVQKSPNLMQRVMRNGMQEVLPQHIATHISPHIFKANFLKTEKSRNGNEVRYPSIATV